jgi:tetratricopeptide (TPR) repeat protein
MAPILALLLAATLVGPGQREEPTTAVRLLHEWMSAVQAHQPGEVDQPLLEVAGWPSRDLDSVRRTLGAALKSLSLRDDERNDLLRRGALLHTDIALLLPERAAEYQQSPEFKPFYLDPTGKPHVVGREADKLFFTLDGEFVTTSVETAHWSMARMLLGAIRPRPESDEFVRLWYRAVAAGFEKEGLFGNANYQLDHGLDVLPRDPVLLFYAGAMHESFASERFQSVPRTRPALAAQLRFPTALEQLRDAETLMGQSVKAHGPVEARVRYARVLGRLGKHDRARTMLKDVAPELREPRLQYLDALFLGSQEGALGHVGEARDAFERAAALYPTAQSPLLALGDLFRRAGNRTAALEALRRLQALPADPAPREDPWTDYFRSFAFDADAQLDAVRAWVGTERR